MAKYGLTYNMPKPVILAKDTARQMVLLGGLGVIGVGTMWVDDSRYRGDPAYATVPDVGKAANV